MRPPPPHPADSARGTLLSLQVIRGLAALLVLCYHNADYIRDTLPGTKLGALLFSEGYLGVDVFFILSGFIMVYSTERPEQSQPGDFVIRRLFRVVPLAECVTLAYLAVVADKPAGAVIRKSLAFLPQADLDPPKFGFPVIPPAWTLTYELLFYGFFAVALLLTHRHRVIACSALLVASVGGFQFALGGPVTLVPNRVALPVHWVGPVRPEVLGVLGNPILLEFVAGMILAAGYRRLAPTLRTDASRAGIRVWSALFLAYFGWGLCSSRIEGNGILAKGGPAAALIAGGILLESSLSRPRAPGSLLRALLWLGAVSYPLYLVHFGFAPRILRFLCSFFLGWRVIGIGGFAGLLALSLAVAALLHRWLELPFIAMGKRLVEWRRGRSARPAPPAAAG